MNYSETSKYLQKNVVFKDHCKWTFYILQSFLQLSTGRCN